MGTTTTSAPGDPSRAARPPYRVRARADWADRCGSDRPAASLDSEPFGNQPAGFLKLLLIIAGFGHRDRDAVRGEENLGGAAVSAGDLADGGANLVGLRFDEQRMVVERAQLVDLRGAASPASARARSMSSRYCRQPEYELKMEVTNASARCTPSARIWRNVSASNGCQLRLPQ